MKDKQETVILVESRWKQVPKDFLSCALLFACIGVGQLIGSEAAEWIFGVLAVLVMLATASNAVQKRRKTPQETANWLARKYGVRAND